MHSRRQLCDEIGRVFRMYAGTTTSSGGMETLVDATLRRYDSAYWVGAQVYIIDAGTGGPNEATSWVTAFDRTTGTITVDPPLWAWVGEGTIYRLYRWVTKEEIDAALAEAVRGLEVATSLNPKTDSLDYYLDGAPGLSRRSQVIGVYVRPHASLRQAPLRLAHWDVEEAEGLLTLRLPFTLNADDQLWITYAADELYFDDPAHLEINLPKQLVIARAAVYLLRHLLVDQDASGQERFGQLLRYYEDVLNREEARYQRPARRAIVPDWDAGGGRNWRTGTPLE
jgi:hypothetical protein